MDFRVLGIHPAGIKILLMMVVLQSLNLVVFARRNRAAWVRILALRQQARGVEAQVEEAPAEKQGPSILVVALKALERLEIGADSRQARDRDPMEGEEVSGVLAEEISGQARQTCNSQ